MVYYGIHYDTAVTLRSMKMIYVCVYFSYTMLQVYVLWCLPVYIQSCQTFGTFRDMNGYERVGYDYSSLTRGQVWFGT